MLGVSCRWCLGTKVCQVNQLGKQCCSYSCRHFVHCTVTGAYDRYTSSRNARFMEVRSEGFAGLNCNMYDSSDSVH